MASSRGDTAASTAGTSAPECSRDSSRGAGWTCRERGSFQGLVPEGHPGFSWVRLSTLWKARNDMLARLLGDPSSDERRRWLRSLEESGGPPDLRLDRTSLESVSLLVLGDTGEGDEGQYAVVPPLLTAGGDTDLMFICSDVVYPAGDAADYGESFYRPYRDYPGPIYAAPGNHDWYDSLSGFMLHFCGAGPLGPRRRPMAKRLSRAGLRDLLWRRSRTPPAGAIARARALRSAERQVARQPGPYFLIDTGPLRIVSIDVGILGEVDRDQARWLRRAAIESRKPKLLLAGKPIYADGAYDPGRTEDGGSVDEIVRAPEHNFVAVVSGDVHNYQRYPVRLADGRTIQYLVNGGGGAYTNATHSIPRVELPGVAEADFRCYPLRGDSLSYFSELYEAWASSRRRRGGRYAEDLRISPAQAAAIMAERIGIEPVRGEGRAVEVDGRARRAAEIVFPAGGYRGWNRFFSQYFDSDDPPLFKSFLRLDASKEELGIRCFAATGCREHEDPPPVEDEVRVPLETSG